MGDTHLYEEHKESALIQIERDPLPFPTLKITKTPLLKSASLDAKIKWIENLTFADFEMQNYNSHPALKYPMVA